MALVELRELGLDLDGIEECEEEEELLEHEEQKRGARPRRKTKPKTGKQNENDGGNGGNRIPSESGKPLPMQKLKVGMAATPAAPSAPEARLAHENERLHNEVRKLKLKLALKEAECLTLKEPLSPTPACAPWHDAETSPSRPQPPHGSARRASASTTTTQGLDSDPAVSRLVAATDWGLVFNDLVSSESFTMVGSGRSVLDTLSPECRRDVVVRYCDVLDRIGRLSNAHEACSDNPTRP